MASRQELLEEEMLKNGIDRYFSKVARAKQKRNKDGKLVDIRDESNTTYGVTMLKYYVESVKDQIAISITRSRKKPGVTPVAWEYLANIDLYSTAFITSKTIINGLSKTTKVANLALTIANKVEDNARFSQFYQEDKKYLQSTQRYIKESKITDYRQKKSVLDGAQLRADTISQWKPWPNRHKIHIGVALLECFITATSDFDNKGRRIKGSAVIQKYTQYSGEKTTVMVAGTEKAFEWIKATHESCADMYPDFMPCVEPPKDWVSPTEGGFHTKEMQARKPLIKTQRPVYLRKLKEHIKQMPTFYKAVNTLQRTAWTVNTIVYNIMAEEFQRNDGVEMPKTEPFTYPDNPLPDWDQGDMTRREFRIHKIQQKKMLSDEAKKEYAEWHKHKRKIEAQERERVSKALQISRTLGVARRFLYEDAIYFVWTADFRGRLYSCGTALSPQGTEKAKALLLFKRGVVLGPNGYEHLCIHAAGVFGNDKCSLADRVKWVEEHKDEIIAVGEDPEGSRDFWKQADKPYSFLAVCLELAECIQLSTKERESFVSHIPCAQDGSCNGIQHYSAMLCDPVGAKAVNLRDGEIPEDIYNDTLEVTKKYLQRTIDEGVLWNGKEWLPCSMMDQHICRLWLAFGMDRALTKKPTMVIPYGGTKLACRDSCRKYLIETTDKRVEEKGEYQNPFKDLIIPDSPDPEIYAISLLHHYVWLALDEVVIAARIAMKFLRDTTRVIVKSEKSGRAVYWTTPTGFIVYMDIKNARNSLINTFLDGRIQLRFKEEVNSIDGYRMGTGIAPNFVHSIDSSHLQMAVSSGKDCGIKDFACVHDSFGIHAGNAELFHAIIRSSFRELHRENLLEEFWKEQLSVKPGLLKEFPDLSDVKRRGFNLDKVLTSRHFFR